jgi:hypothetical protein
LLTVVTATILERACSLVIWAQPHAQAGVFFLLACPRNGNFQIDDIDQRSRVEWPGSFRKWLEKIVVGVDGRSGEKL